ncbi:MAG: hypothetical protein J3K34DRAFT_512842 [Monoraphidium minutum]|nr:MAG: hypothetical protein J3K34DRAFT_512842 [Monoraphidium minutum]
MAPLCKKDDVSGGGEAGEEIGDAFQLRGGEDIGVPVCYPQLAGQASHPLGADAARSRGRARARARAAAAAAAAAAGRATGLGGRRGPRPCAAAAAAARARAARRRRARTLRVCPAAAPAAAGRRGPVAGPLAAVRPGRPLGRPLGRRGGRRLRGGRLGGRCRGGSRLGAIHLHVISGLLPHPPHAALPLRLAAAAAAAAARRRVGRAGPARRAGSRRRRRAAAGRGRGADRRVGGVDGLRVLHCPPLAADGARVPHPEDVAPRLAQLGGEARGKGRARAQRRAPPALVRRHLLPEQPDLPLPCLLLVARRHVRVARLEKLAALPAAAGQREQQQLNRLVLAR